MDSEIWSFITYGAIIAVFIVFHKWRVRQIKKKQLRGMLSDARWQWRSIEALQRAIGEDEKTTKDLLISIGARGSVQEKDVWTLD
jgi:hypothetical protein